MNKVNARLANITPGHRQRRSAMKSTDAEGREACESATDLFPNGREMYPRNATAFVFGDTNPHGATIQKSGVMSDDGNRPVASGHRRLGVTADWMGSGLNSNSLERAVNVTSQVRFPDSHYRTKRTCLLFAGLRQSKLDDNFLFGFKQRRLIAPLTNRIHCCRHEQRRAAHGFEAPYGPVPVNHGM
jgi:hypothetical protein